MWWDPQTRKNRERMASDGALKPRNRQRRELTDAANVNTRRRLAAGFAEGTASYRIHCFTDAEVESEILGAFFGLSTKWPMRPNVRHLVSNGRGSCMPVLSRAVLCESSR